MKISIVFGINILLKMWETDCGMFGWSHCVFCCVLFIHHVTMRWLYTHIVAALSVDVYVTGIVPVYDVLVA